MMCEEDVSHRGRRIRIRFSLLMLLFLFMHPGNARPQELTAKDFLGPAPGIAVIFDSPGGFGPERVIGMGMDEHGICRIAHEIPLPPQTIPDPLHPGEFLARGYFQQRLLAENRRIILKVKALDTVILDMSKDKWTSDVAVQIACTGREATSNTCPGSIVIPAEFSIEAKTKIFLLGRQRTVLTVHCAIRTSEYGDAGSTDYTFISGIGVINGSMPADIRKESLSDQALAILAARIEARHQDFDEK